MSKPLLKVMLLPARQSARFSGPATFEAKDVIKTLGPSRWNRDGKLWEVQPFKLSWEELEARLSGFALELIPPEDESAAPPSGYSVSQLSAAIAQALTAAFPQTVLVYGVVSAVKSAGGRVFLDLAEKTRPDESLNCVIWQDAERILGELTAHGFTLEKDLDLMLEVRVDLNRRNGRVSLAVLRVVAEYTIAKVAALREVTNRRLKEEQLFDRNRTVAFAFLPQRLGIITSASGTVINDFVAALEEAQFGFELYWQQVAVQGVEAKAQLIRALQRFSSFDVDAVLLFRGGGSTADLAVFNDYDVARAVCLSPHPVLSAIGHQEDHSSVQDVSWRSFGVPKDLGHFLAGIVLDFRRRLTEAARVTAAAAQSIGDRCEQQLSFAAQRIALRGTGLAAAFEEGMRRLARVLPGGALACLGYVRGELEHLTREAITRSENEIGSRLDHLRHVLRRGASLAAAAERFAGEQLAGLRAQIRIAVQYAEERTAARLESLGGQIQSASPEVQLQRGFVIVRCGEQVVTRGAELRTQQAVDLQFIDERKRALIQ